MSTTFHITNFGCRAAQADGAAIERELARRGWSACDGAQAEVAILNTCTVTAAADSDARAAIRRIHRENPECKILVTGCYAQRAPEEIAALAGVEWVVGNSHKHEIGKLLARTPQSFVSLNQLKDSLNQEPGPPARPAFGRAGVVVGDIFAHTELLAAPVFDVAAADEHTRPNLKVQDGCNNRCSFCVIPSVRGRSRSLPLAEVLREVKALVDLGYREVVISGINLGRWGRDLRLQLRFVDLVCAILSETQLEKLRISSVEPMDWNDELIKLVATHPRLARHAHVPLQSGSDAVLRRMHRKYRPWHYAQRIEKIRAASPDAAIGADVMTGFPGESDAEFEESRKFIEALPFTYLHVFTFSPRPGTPAAATPNQVPVHVARERTRLLRSLSAKKNLQFRESFVGRELEAITLHRHDNHGHTDAVTSNYLKLRISGEHAPNQWLRAKIHNVSDDGVIGTA